MRSKKPERCEEEHTLTTSGTHHSVLRPISHEKCPKGEQHEIVHKNGENYCKKCGLVFDNDISFTKDNKQETTQIGFD